MCQAVHDGSTLFSPASASPFGVSRAYRDAQDEAEELLRHPDFDALTVVLALFLEAILIGDQSLATCFKNTVIALTHCLAGPPRFLRAAPVMRRLVECAINNSTVRRYTEFEVDTWGRVLPIRLT